LPIFSRDNIVSASSQRWMDCIKPNSGKTSANHRRFQNKFSFPTHICVFKRERLKCDWVVENRDRMSHFSFPVNIRGWVGKLSESRFQVHPRSQPLIYFWCGACCCAGWAI